MGGGGGLINFKTLPRILGRERCKVEGMDGNLLQNIVFKFLALILDLSEVFSIRKIKWGCLYVSGAN